MRNDDGLDEEIKEFKDLEKIYSLEEVCEEECPMCGGKITFYESKYIDGVSVRFCWHCYELEKGIDTPSSKDNICPYCSKIVKFEDEDRDNYVECAEDTCEQKAHRSCAEDYICDNCNIWACENHASNFIECDYCGRLHDENCIVSLGSGFVDTFGNICESCFYRDEDLIEEIKRPLKGPEFKELLLNIDSKREFYIKEAKENFDLSIMLTHLIKGEEPYEILKTILYQGKLKAAITGYYGNINSTSAVCFTDLTTRGLLRHSKNYSPFGIAFLKEIIFQKGGAPALYIREDILKNILTMPDKIKPFINKINIERYDFHHEREWRVPNDFFFNHNEISIVYAPIKYHDELRKLFPNIKQYLDLDILQLI